MNVKFILFFEEQFTHPKNYSLTTKYNEKCRENIATTFDVHNFETILAVYGFPRFCKKETILSERFE